MSAEHIIQTGIEVSLVLLVLWCFRHEDKLIRFENRLLERLKRWRCNIRRRIAAWINQHWNESEPEPKPAQAKREPILLRKD